MDETVLTAVFKCIVDNLHDTRSMLENGDFGTLVHFQSAIQQAVHGDTCVAVNAVQVS
jgi:hypothetical protein